MKYNKTVCRDYYWDEEGNGEKPFINNYSPLDHDLESIVIIFINGSINIFCD